MPTIAGVGGARVQRRSMHTHLLPRAMASAGRSDAVALWSPASLNPGLSATTSASLTSTGFEVLQGKKTPLAVVVSTTMASATGKDLMFLEVSSPPVAGGRRADIRLD
jgi:hypothetical protein